MIYRRKTKKIPPISKTPLKIRLNMSRKLWGFMFFFLWMLSIMAGLFVFICPALPLIFISPKKYRKWADLVFGMWEPFSVALLEIFFGTRVVLTGDKINPFEGSLFIMNHRTRVDWCFLWLGLFHYCQPNAHNMKYILKSSIRHLPGAGWVMQTCSFIFIHRNWQKDKPLLDKMVDYLNESDPLYQILIFPEGTDFTESNVQKSHKYAAENNLERYYKVLHPRTKGFSFLANKMKKCGQLDAIYDVTIAYPKTMPQNEVDLLKGIFPEEVHFHVKRHTSFPFQEQELKNWLMNIWREKEKSLQRFYARGFFSSSTAAEEDDSKIDYGRVGKKNGVVSYKHQEMTTSHEDNDSHMKDLASSSVTSVPEQKSEASGSSANGYSPQAYDTSNHTNCDNIFRSKNYKPSHLLFVILFFWLIMISFVLYGFLYSYYMRLWIYIHSLLFSGLSLVSIGFQYIIASCYFYRYNIRSEIVKKNE